MNTNTKTAVITGAGSGIGFAVAEAFVREGTNVVLNGRTEDKLTRVAAKLDHRVGWRLSPVTSPRPKRPAAS